MSLDSTLADIFGWLWIVSWFLSIWVQQYRLQLFFTGLFAMILCMGLYDASKKEKSKDDSKIDGNKIL